MSKFRSRIRDIGRAPGGLGFAALAKRERPRYVLVVAEAGSAAEASAAAQAGADAIVFNGSVPADTDLRVPFGVRIEAGTREAVEAAREAGADFFIFDDDQTHAAALTIEEMGSVLILDGDHSEERLRMVGAIDLDAILVRSAAGNLTVRQQIELRRVAGMGGAPVLVQADGKPDAGCLEAWRDAGAPAVLVSASDVERTLEAAMLVPPPRRSTDRRVAALGGPVVESHDHDHDDD